MNQCRNAAAVLILTSLVITTLVLTGLAVADDFDTLAEKVVFQDIEGLEELLASGVDVNARSEQTGGTILILACSYQDFEDVIALLLEHDADVHARSNDGRTALIWAAARSLQAVEMLLEREADVNATANDGMTALIHAVMGVLSESVTVEVPELLLAEGADVNAQLTGEGIKGWTALMFATSGEQPKLVEFLLANGAEVDAQTADGKSALMMACENGDRKTVDVLLAAGADVTLENEAGETALSLAQAHDHTAIVNALRKKEP
jgi:ankyrin repeat protein